MPRRTKTPVQLPERPMETGMNGIALVYTGWLDGRRSYLWFGERENGPCWGTLSGPRLYALAKKIVATWEQEE